MPRANAIGMLEFSSIAIGHDCEDAMLKAADVELILARTICSGKFIVIVSGDVAAVRASVQSGIQIAPDSVIEELVIPNVHEQVFPALTGSVDLSARSVEALGLVESFSATSILEGADAAVKAAEVLLFRVHVAMAIGGKGYLMLTGSVGSTRAAVEAAADVIGARGMLVSKIVIPAPRAELFREFI
jgi:microcompartment protein CcmL/EutN